MPRFCIEIKLLLSGQDSSPIFILKELNGLRDKQFKAF